LPPDPPVEITGELQARLSQADRALGRLDGSIQTLPNPDLFVYMYVRKEAVLSSQIEGTQSSLQDVLAAEAKILAPDRPKDVDEVVNYVHAMKYGLKRLVELPVSVRLIREIHAELLQGVRGSQLTPGELRTSQNWIGPSGCILKEATFVPPPPDDVPQKMAELEQFLHTDSGLPLLITIGLAHAQFETIHPFLDGNGRIGRCYQTARSSRCPVITGTRSREGNDDTEKKRGGEGADAECAVVTRGLRARPPQESMKGGRKGFVESPIPAFLPSLSPYPNGQSPTPTTSICSFWRTRNRGVTFTRPA